MGSNKLLIICYSFPPSPGIGGRRWAKFASYLHRLGIDVQVLSAEYTGNQTSEWQKDTEELVKESRVHFFKTGYPTIIQQVPKNFLEKIKYHLVLSWLKRKIKGNYYDRSSLCKDHLLAEVEKFIKQGYRSIVISVGPFYYSKYLLEIKKKYPDVKLFLDVRDPWTNNKTAFGYWNLSAERFAFEKQAEKAVVNGYDKILTVADGIGDFFASEYAIHQDKIITLKNGFDNLDFKLKTIEKTGKQVIIFTGNLYEKAENSFLMLVHQLKNLKASKSDFFEQYEIHFYGEIHPSFKHYFTPEINLYFKGNIPLADVFSKIASAKACLLFLTDDLNYSFSTKFYEYLSQKKPIIVFSNPGKTGEFVEENNLGRQANSNNFISILNEIENDRFYKKAFDISEFEVGHLTKQLIHYLELDLNIKEREQIVNEYKQIKPKQPVLFVAFQFPPAGGPGVQRSVKFVNNLQNYNYQPFVLTTTETVSKTVSPNLDQSLSKFIPSNTQVYRVPFYQPMTLIKVFTKLKIFRLLWYFLYPLFWEKSAFWPFQAYKTAKAIITKENIKIVYTTSGPFSALILGYLLKRNLKVKWVADIRDPFTDGYQWSFPSKLHWFFMRKMEHFIYAKCDHLIVNTNAVKQLYLKRGLKREPNISVITNGY